MASFENTVVIGRPIEEEFGFLRLRERSQVELRHRRDPGFRGPVGAGTIYQQVRSVPSRSEERFEVTASWRSRQLGPFPSRLAYVLGAVPEGTWVTNSVELQLRGPGRLLGRVAVPWVRDALAANLSKLKELLER